MLRVLRPQILDLRTAGVRVSPFRMAHSPEIAVEGSPSVQKPDSNRYAEHGFTSAQKSDRNRFGNQRRCQLLVPLPTIPGQKLPHESSKSRNKAGEESPYLQGRNQ